MAEEGVIVDQEAAINLAHYLTEIGRLHNKTAREVGAAIQSGVNSMWGTAKVPQFRDGDGIGWVVDISDRFNGEALYGIIRSKEGQRHVTEVITEDVLSERFPRKSNQSSPPKEERPSQRPPFQPEVAQQAAQHSAAIETLTQELAAARAQKEELEQRLERANAKIELAQNGDPNGPALVRWKVATKSENGQGFEKEEEEITVGAVGEKVQALINIGVKADHIEVWSRRKQPRVRVELE